MTRTEIAKDLRQFTGVREKYLNGLEHLGNAYLITEVAARMKEEMEA